MVICVPSLVLMAFFFYTVQYCGFSVLLQPTHQMQFLLFYSCMQLKLGLPKQERSGMQPGSLFGGHHSPVWQPSSINRARDKDKCECRVLCNYTQIVTSQINIPSILRELAA